MAYQSISFQTPGPRAGGELVPTHSVTVNIREPKRPMSIAATTRLLEGVLESMQSVDCTFWACEGPQRPRHMVTCSRCWAVRDLQRALRHLRARMR